ncbi:brain-enriched guanylate kinase-associated protein [Pristis pectinata]|uniref:brain-enriched guanylate kinase-associated protein n=1 Tax=Pristis pectinata TaxID=685728 RepID=UPI00223CCA11|nr:brain-enriched guanylate kinase-associated protein [Pristis pectinata]
MSSPNKTSLKSRSSSLSRNINTVTAAKMEKISSSQKQNEQLQEHQLEQEFESDTTHSYLKAELKRAQEELKKLAGKLRRTRNNHTALQKVNQDLENKLHRMAQLHEKEKRNLNHEVNILSCHLMEAKMTIEKLTGDNLPTGIQGSLGECTEKFGHGLPGTVCESPISEIQTHMLENSESICLPGSPKPVSPSRQATHGLMKDTDKLDQRSQFKPNLYCSDTALYCPAEQRRGRSKVRDMQDRNVGFFRSQSFTDSFVEVEDFSTSPSSELPPNYSPPVSTFSNYLSCSRTSKKKGTAQTTMNPSQHFHCFDMRDNVYEKKCSPSEEYRTNKSSPVHAGPLQFKGMTHDSTQHSYATLPTHFNDSLSLSRIMTQQGRAPKLYSDQRDIHEPEKNTMDQCRKINKHYSCRAPGRISSSSYTEQQPDNSLMKRTTHQGKQWFATSREDNFLDGEDPDQNNFADSDFRAISGADYNYIQKQDTFSMSKQNDTEKDPKPLSTGKETNQMCMENSNDVANVRKYIDVAPMTSADSSHRHPITLFVVHNVPLDNGVLNAKEKSSKLNGLYRKDSLTKAQLYGNLLN